MNSVRRPSFAPLTRLLFQLMLCTLTLNQAIEAGPVISDEPKTMLHIKTSAPGAKVLIDGILAGSANRPLDAEPGTATVLVEAPGHTSSELTVTIQKGIENVYPVILLKPAAPAKGPATKKKGAARQKKVPQLFEEEDDDLPSSSPASSPIKTDGSANSSPLKTPVNTLRDENIDRAKRKVEQKKIELQEAKAELDRALDEQAGPKRNSTASKNSVSPQDIPPVLPNEGAAFRNSDSETKNSGSSKKRRGSKKRTRP